jgi:hypothetical protein
MPVARNGMIADRCEDAGGCGATADHAPSGLLVDRMFGQCGRCAARATTEQPALSVFSDAGGGDVGVPRIGERVMARHHTRLAAFFMQPDQPAWACRAQILYLHLQRRGNAREGIDEVAINGRSRGSRAVMIGMLSVSLRHSVAQAPA